MSSWERLRNQTRDFSRRVVRAGALFVKSVRRPARDYKIPRVEKKVSVTGIIPTNRGAHHANPSVGRNRSVFDVGRRAGAGRGKVREGRHNRDGDADHSTPVASV